MLKILIVEDECNLLMLYSRFLSQQGYDTLLAVNGFQALDIIMKKHVDLVVADFVVPNLDGYEMINKIREINKEVPIIIVSENDSLYDKKKAFLAGADDYMVKPIELEELGLRVNSILKRTRAVSKKILNINNVIIDMNSLSIHGKDYSIKLPKKEFLLLFKLMSQPNFIFTRKQLMDEIWGFNKNSQERTVDVHVKRIRKRINIIKEFKLETVYGVGYKGVII